MLIDRIIGAITFRKGVYEEVEKDTTFTAMAWVLVIGAAFLNAFGTSTAANVYARMVGAGIDTAIAVITFGIAAYLIAWTGTSRFGADVDFNEMVRTLGLAYVWNAVGIIGMASILSPTLQCLTAPIAYIAGVAGLAAWLVAVNEALDLELSQTIMTVLLGWIGMFLFRFFVNIALSAVEFGSELLNGVFP